MTKNAETQVAIVGAGPVGLTLAIELGLRGVGCTLVEQHEGHPRVPRMSGVSSRNMEFCRRWGIAEKVRGAAWSDTHPSDFVYVESMTGRELARLPIPSYREREGRIDYSPEGSATCPQIYFDPLLAEKARSVDGVTLRYGTRLESFEQDGAGVRAHLVDARSGEPGTVSARYLVGCDGAGGTVRRELAIPLDGQGTIARSVNIFFRSPRFMEMHDKGWARFFRCFDEDGCWGEAIGIDGRELWRLSVFHDSAPDLTGRSYLRKLAGRDFDYEIIDVSPWERRDFVARSFRSGRVLIAGDAAHEASPTGGAGMHIGVCEAVNLAWKLAALLDGWGGGGLLDSYQTESKPIAERIVELSTRTYDALAALPGREAFREAFEEDPGILLTLTLPEQLRAQFCYEESPICVPDGTPPPEGADELLPSARPGTRAPHCWIGEGRSTLDLFGGGFVLVRFGAAPPDVAPIAAAAASAGVPLEVVDIDRPEAADLYGRRLVLVRPDGHVAWRSDMPPDDPAALIDRVRGAAQGQFGTGKAEAR